MREGLGTRRMEWFFWVCNVVYIAMSMQPRYGTTYLWNSSPTARTNTGIVPAEEKHTSVIKIEVPNVSPGVVMTSTPSSTTTPSPMSGSPPSVHTVIELGVGGLPKRHTKQVLVMASGKKFMFASLAVMLIVSSQSCERAGGGGGDSSWNEYWPLSPPQHCLQASLSNPTQ